MLIRSLVLTVAVTQLGTWLMVQQAGVLALASWLLVILLFPPRGLLYVFQLNVEEPFLRRLLPINQVILLLADTALPLLLLALSSMAVWLLLDFTFLTAIFGALLAFLMDTILVFSLGAALAEVRVASIPRPYVGLGLGSMGSIMLMSLLTTSPIILTIHAALLVGLLGRLIADDSEATTVQINLIHSVQL